MVSSKISDINNILAAKKAYNDNVNRINKMYEQKNIEDSIEIGANQQQLQIEKDDMALHKEVPVLRDSEIIPSANKVALKPNEGRNFADIMAEYAGNRFKNIQLLSKKGNQAIDENISMQEMAVTLSKAELEVQELVEIRNSFVDAWNKIVNSNI